jgi:hypothetical protein
MYREIVETFRPETGPTGQESQTRKTMSKSLITLLLAFFLAGPAWPQEEASGSDTEDPETTEADGAAEAEMGLPKQVRPTKRMKSTIQTSTSRPTRRMTMISFRQRKSLPTSRSRFPRTSELPVII